MNAKWISPVITPLNNDGSIDYASAEKMYDNLINAGINGILVGGSLGEFFAFTYQQRLELAKFAINYINKRTKLIIGTTSMVYDEIVSLSNEVLDAGADAVIIIPPYYFSLGDNEMYAYYTNLSRDIHGNIYIYNFPDRTGYTINPDIIVKIAEECENIIGIKDTIAGIDHTREIITKVKKVRPTFEVYSGFDENFAHNVLGGGDGCIGGLSNLAPDLCMKWVNAVNNEDVHTMAECQKTVNECMSVYTIGAPFIPYVKEAAFQMGLIRSSKATFPITDLTEESAKKVTTFLKSVHFI